jgi:TRAP transporter TAXI family solute receptor
MKKIIIFLTITSLILLFIGCGNKQRFVVIGTGGISGVYYPVGGSVAALLNKKTATYNMKFTHRSTGGSVYNINTVLKGDIEFGIAQSDRQYQAGKGLAEWQELGPQAKLRSVFSLHSEAVTVVVADDSKIKTIKDLKGKHVNIGNPGSGTRKNALDTFLNFNIDIEKDIKTEAVKAAEAPGLLQDGRIDAFFYTVGHPSAAFKEVSSGKRKVSFLSITGIDTLLEQHPYYAVTTIPITHYPNFQNTEDVPTYGVKATLVTSADVPEEIVYAVTKEVFENLDKFRKLHDALSTLTKESMLEGLSVPFHKGALKYFKEAGLK